MAKEYKKLAEWLEGLGYNHHVWIGGGDWSKPMDLLAKLLQEQLAERRPLDNVDQLPEGVRFKISFDSMSELAEEILGIPALVSESDLKLNFPNIYLAQLVQLAAFRDTLEKIDIDEKSLRCPVNNLVFEARNGMDAQFPCCPGCGKHMFFLERVIVEKVVWHRKCLKCAECGVQLHTGSYKKTKGKYECIAHAVRKILDEKEPKKSPRPKIAPPPPPPSNIGTRSDCEDNYETLEIDTPSMVAGKSPMSPPSDTFGRDPKPKPVPPPKPKYLVFPKPPIVDDHPGCSSDSGVSVGSSNTYEVVEGPCTSTAVLRREVNHHPLAPTAPPRPKRASMLLTASTTPPLSRHSMIARTPSPTTSSSTPTAAPRSSFNTATRRAVANPFEETEDLKVAFDYDESKNPFADSDEEEERPIPAPRKTILASLLPGESDRPKSMPPPPPLLAPPTPTETKEAIAEQASEKLRTLRISKKKKRAPLPPGLRKAIATSGHEGDDSNNIAAKVKHLDEDIVAVERKGKEIEKELLLKITTNPKDWYKLPRTDDYIATAFKLFDILRQQDSLQYSWKEAYLTEVHSETDALLRSLIEKDLNDDASQSREKHLLSLLVYIMDEKAKLTESHRESSQPRSRESSVTRKEKKSTMKLRMALLSKKLRKTKK